MNLRALFSLVLLLIMGACKVDSDNSGSVVAAFKGDKLFLEDIADQLPTKGQMNPADSTSFVNNLIKDWAIQTLLVKEAEFNLDQGQLDIEDLVDQYRNDLLIHAYVERYVAQNLDTNFSPAEIRSYYEENKESFELKESIVQASFVAAPVEAQGLEDAKRWFVKGGAQLDEFWDWAEVFANKQSHYGLEDWITLSDLMSDVPLETANPYAFFDRNPRFVSEDSVLTYFVQVKSVKIENSFSPLNYVEDRILKVLLNKRRLALIAKMEENIINDAIEEGSLTLP